jgi:2-polyprenyl-6-methoxyphenol hydroxylase-like FAD-dependent oxidoreductase
MHGQQRFGKAIVIGGSIAGLLSARVLSDFFEKVIVLERDPAPGGPEARKSVPQGRHVHALLEAGRTVLDSLFPGLVRELGAEGASVIDMGRDMAWFHSGAWKVRYVSGIEALFCTRPWLEWKIRGRVAALPGVELRHGCSAEELLMDATRTRIVGARVRTPEGEAQLEASLVVDVSGRGSRAPRWLEALGYGRPEEEKIGIDLAYTSRFYERPAHPSGDWKVLAVFPRAPGERRAGFVASVEGERWIVSLNGYFGDCPPTDEPGFLEFARSLPTRALYEAIRSARPLTPAVTHKLPAGRWLRYERMERFPEGLVLLGDSVCVLNPIYGQGMTVISLSARLLGECLAAQASSSPGELRGLSRRFQRKLSRFLFLPWLMASTLDLKYPQAQGQRFLGLGLLHWSFGTLIDLTSLDMAASRQFYEVMHMRRGLETLLKPGFLKSFLTYGLKSLFVPLPRRANVDTLPPAPA